MNPVHTININKYNKQTDTVTLNAYDVPKEATDLKIVIIDNHTDLPQNDDFDDNTETEFKEIDTVQLEYMPYIEKVTVSDPGCCYRSTVVVTISNLPRLLVYEGPTLKLKQGGPFSQLKKIVLNEVNTWPDAESIQVAPESCEWEISIFGQIDRPHENVFKANIVSISACQYTTLYCEDLNKMTKLKNLYCHETSFGPHEQKAILKNPNLRILSIGEERGIPELIDCPMLEEFGLSGYGGIHKLPEFTYAHRLTKLDIFAEGVSKGNPAEWAKKFTNLTALNIVDGDPCKLEDFKGAPLRSIEGSITQESKDNIKQWFPKVWDDKTRIMHHPGWRYQKTDEQSEDDNIEEQ